jgi:signal peptidase II
LNINLFNIKSNLKSRAKFIVFALLLCGSNILLDRISKNLAVRFLQGQKPLVFFNDLLVLIYAENSGAFLSLGASWPQALKFAVLLVLPIIICFVVLLWLMFKEERLWRVITGSCIIGGGLSNLTDRLVNNFYVIDFINLGIGKFRTGILNIADISVTFGVIVLLIMERRVKCK